MNDKMKPCPFCGEKFLDCLSIGYSQDIGDIFVMCNKCLCRGPVCNGAGPFYELAKTISIDNWNNRP